MDLNNFNSKGLNGAKLVLVSDDEMLRSEAYGIIASNGWESQLELLETDDEYDTLLDNITENHIVIFLSEKFDDYEERLLRLIDNDFPQENILVSISPNNFKERLLCKNIGLKSFVYEQKRTPARIEINLAELPNKCIEIWNQKRKLILSGVIESSLNSGALPLIESVIGNNLVDKSIERSHYAYGIITSISNDITTLKKVIKCSLFFDLIKLPKWEEVVSKTRFLWDIKSELTQINNSSSAEKLELVPLIALCTEEVLGQESTETAETLLALEPIISKSSLMTRVALKSSIVKIFELEQAEEGLREAS